MTTEQYSIGYEAGYQDGWNEAQKPFVGLTDEDKQKLAAEQHDWESLCFAVEAKLKDKTT